MNKLIIGIGLGVMVFVGTCGFNRSIFDTNYTFNKAYISWPNGDMKVIDIKSWRDYEGEQIQIVAKDGRVYLCSSYNTILVNEK